MTPRVLFVCVHNAGRSQMAAGTLRHLAGDAVDVRTAGSAPADTINPAAVEGCGRHPGGPFDGAVHSRAGHPEQFRHLGADVLTRLTGRVLRD